MTRTKPSQVGLLGCLLLLFTGALYWPAIHHEFVDIDDVEYVTENPWVTGGLGFAGLKWALTRSYAANWHPLTWVSHQFDYTLWGAFAGGHHLTSILLHAFNTLLLFVLLKRLTESVWPSFLAAALFGWHPLHVESVAWIAERKDVLSTLFFLLTLIAYAIYAESKVQSPKSKVQSREPQAQVEAEPQDPSCISQHPARFYWLALIFFALGLMSKQMLVTLPFVLLLLDYWPLGRFQLAAVYEKGCEGTPFLWRQEVGASLRRLLPFLKSALFLEKLPFFVLAFGASAITLVAQRAGGAVKSVEEVPIGLRTPNALSAYGHYLVGAVWPVKLCVFYPLPAKPPVFWAVLSAGALLTITWLSFRARKKQPWALVGWLWFLGTLIPVIGLVQVGTQARADRYTYIPFIGLFLAAIWCAANFFKRCERGRELAGATALAGLVCCLGMTRCQLRYWQDSLMLFSRAVAVTKDNWTAENDLGVALANAGKTDEAIVHHKEAVRIDPRSVKARYNLGIELATVGELDQAAHQFSEALELQPRSEILHNNFGVILARQDKLDLAVQHFQQAIRLNPQYPKPNLNYALVVQKKGQAGLAFTNYQRALQLDATWPEALDKMAFLLATCPTPEYHDPQTAMRLAERANELTFRASADYLDTLAIAYAAAGEFSKAISTAENARAQALNKGSQALAESLGRDLESYRAGRGPELDWRDPRSGRMEVEGRAKGASGGRP